MKTDFEVGDKAWVLSSNIPTEMTVVRVEAILRRDRVDIQYHLSTAAEMGRSPYLRQDTPFERSQIYKRKGTAKRAALRAVEQAA